MINYSFYSTIIRGDWGICSLWPGNSPVISRECPVAAGYPISGRTSVGSWAALQRLLPPPVLASVRSILRYPSVWRTGDEVSKSAGAQGNGRQVPAVGEDRHRGVNCPPPIRVQVISSNMVLASRAAGTGVRPVRKHREWTVCG